MVRLAVTPTIVILASSNTSNHTKHGMSVSANTSNNTENGKGSNILIILMRAAVVVIALREEEVVVVVVVVVVVRNNNNNKTPDAQRPKSWVLCDDYPLTSKYMHYV